MNHETHPHFVPSNFMGTRKDTAVVLVGTAREHKIPQRDIASTANGFYITDALADALDADEAEAEQAEPDTEPEKPAKKAEAKPKTESEKTDTKKTSGNRAAKNSPEGGK